MNAQARRSIEFWRAVNWSYPNFALARELGVSPRVVQSWRRRIHGATPRTLANRLAKSRAPKPPTESDAKRVDSVDWTLIDWEWDDKTLAADYDVPRAIVAQKRREFCGRGT